MNNLKLYVDFSYKYKILVGDNLNLVIKHYIWIIYKKIIAIELIKKFLNKNIFQCKECRTHNWKLFGGIHQKFYYVDMCNNFDPCCRKYICLPKCSFNLYCNVCKKNKIFQAQSKITDIGWNSVEGKKNIIIKCIQCGYSRKRRLKWNNCN